MPEEVMRRWSRKDHGALTLGHVREALSIAQPTAYVQFDVFGLFWGEIDSWRGSYDEPTITWSEAPRTAEEALAQVDAALNGRVFQGYKGGQYRFHENSPIHVDKYGHCTRTEVTEIRVSLGGTYVLLCLRWGDR